MAKRSSPLGSFHRLSADKMMVKYLISLTLSAVLLVCPSFARAENAEELSIVPSYLAGNEVRFSVPGDINGQKVDRLTVHVRSTLGNGRVEQQAFDIHPNHNWSSSRIQAATKYTGIKKMELTYIAHVRDASGQRRAVESKNVWELTGQPKVAGPNPGRLRAVDAAQVQRAMDTLAKTGPKASFYTTPGEYQTKDGTEVKLLDGKTAKLNPLHPELHIIRAIETVIGQQKQDPQGKYFIRGSVYNMDSSAVAHQLIEAKKAGVSVELLTDHSLVHNKYTHDKMVGAGISVVAMVRNDPAKGSNDARTNHSKFWVIGKEDHAGKISQASTFQSSFNHEFQNWPGNTEALTEYRNNTDVATIYNYYHRAMAGRAPHLKLTVNPQSSQFISTHTLYPHVRADNGKPFTARQAYEHLIASASQKMDFLQYLAQDEGLLKRVGQRVSQGVKATFRVNDWKVSNHGAGGLWGHLGNSNIVGVQLNGSSPVHHKSAQADGRLAVTGSYNMWGPHVNDGSDEQVDFHRSPRMAQAIRDEAHNLDHAYYVNQHRGGKSQHRTADVAFDIDLGGIASQDVKSVKLTTTKYLHRGEMPGEKKVEEHQLTLLGRTFQGKAKLSAGHFFYGQLRIELKSGQVVTQRVDFKARTPVGASHYPVRVRLPATTTARPRR